MEGKKLSAWPLKRIGAALLESQLLTPRPQHLTWILTPVPSVLLQPNPVEIQVVFKTPLEAQELSPAAALCTYTSLVETPLL